MQHISSIKNENLCAPLVKYILANFSVLINVSIYNLAIHITLPRIFFIIPFIIFLIIFTKKLLLYSKTFFFSSYTFMYSRQVSTVRAKKI